MAWQPIVIGGLFGGGIRGAALGAYRPLHIKNAAGEKIKNPAFDHHSQQILNLKSPDKPNYFQPAVTYCTAHLSDYLRDHFHGPAEILIVPSSTKGGVSPGLEKVVKAICKREARFIYNKGGLVRTQTIDKLARGGNRSIGVHLESLEYTAIEGVPMVKILLDDVMTTGHSLEGASTVIHQVQPGIQITAIVFGKTTHD
jgi:hypothetical protein